MADEKGLETLQVWQKSMNFAIKIQKDVLPLFPVEEKWSLSTQLRRSVQSIPANIAEGYGRYYYQEGVRFCYMARGSSEETYSHLKLALCLGYLSETSFQELAAEIQELQRLLNGYISYLKKSKRGESEPGSTGRISDDPADYSSSADVQDPLPDHAITWLPDD